MMYVTSLPAAEVRPFLREETPVVMGEVLMFARVLTPLERAQVQHYLRRRWTGHLTRRKRRQAKVERALELRRDRMRRTVRVPGRVEVDEFTSALMHECADE